MSEADKLDLEMSGVRALQAGGTASAKALRPERASSVSGVNSK